MATFTESSLIARARRRADMVNSSFVTDEEIRDYLNSSMSELHDFMVKSYEDYFVSTHTYTIPLASGGENLPKLLQPIQMVHSTRLWALIIIPVELLRRSELTPSLIATSTIRPTLLSISWLSQCIRSKGIRLSLFRRTHSQARLRFTMSL